MVLILQIPPIDPSASLRTQYLLRLTNEVLNSVPGYPPATSVLEDVVSWLDDLDEAWLVVLESRMWDPEKGTGRDLVIEGSEAAAGIKSTPMSQTDVTRLRSLLVGAIAELEDWLSGGNDGEDLEKKLQRMGLQEKFDNVFSSTLDFLGGFGGFVIEPMSEIE